MRVAVLHLLLEVLLLVSTVLATLMNYVVLSTGSVGTVGLDRDPGRVLLMAESFLLR